MPNLADKAYLALAPESVEGVAEAPAVFLPLEEEGITSELNLAADRRMAGIDWETTDLSPGERTHTGPIKVWADPDSLGYILSMVLTKGSSSGSGADGYTHPFTPGTPQSYTVEIPRGDYAFRFFGVRGSQLRMLFEEAKLKAELVIAAMGQFSVASIRDALTGGVSDTVAFVQDYDLEPTRGILAGDTLVFLDDGEEVEVDSLEEDGITINLTGAVVGNHSAGARLALKKSTPNIGTLQKPFFFGDLLVGFGSNAANAETAAGAKATATPAQAVEITYDNNLMNAPFSNYRDNSILLPRVKSLVLNLKHLFEDPGQRQKWLEITKQGISLILRGELIKTTAPTTRNQLKITLHKAKLEQNGNPLNVGEYIFDEQTFRAAYDSGDAKAITVELINETDGANYEPPAGS